MNKRQAANQRGQFGERVAAWFLRAKGYRLLAARYKTSRGEIDLIMRRGSVVVFVEVKARPSVDDAVYAVSPFQAKRIVAAAKIWLSRNPMHGDYNTRFDIVAVSPYLWPTHIVAAFTEDA